MKVILFAGAEIRDYSFCESYMDGADAVICCDAGMRHAKALGIDPDYIVGDFDSTASEVLEYYKAKNIPVPDQKKRNRHGAWDYSGTGAGRDRPCSVRRYWGQI